MSVTGCACKRGFLVLRDCGNSAQGVCPQCSRGICSEHFAADLNLCVECAAQGAPDEGMRSIQGRFGHPARTAARIRSTHYREHGYHPYSWGYPTAYYDTYDVGAFDDTTTPDWEPDAGPSFSDS